jgi:predicted dehydrogenase
MQHLIADGYVGRCYHFHIRFLSNQGRNPAYTWTFDPQRSIGALGAIGSHMIDLAQFFQGDITRVNAHLATSVERVGPDGQPMRSANDSALLSVEYANGVQGMIHVSMVAHTADRYREQYVSLHGNLGSLEADWKVLGTERKVILRGARHDEQSFQALPIPDKYLNGVELGSIVPVFEKHLVGPRLFIDAICNDYMPTPNFHNGFKVQQVMDAALKSHDSGCWVDVSS